MIIILNIVRYLDLISHFSKRATTCTLVLFSFRSLGKIKVEAGKPGETIHRIADQQKVTCIVMGGRGMSTLRRTLLGGVSDYVIKHTQIPVIFIPGQQ